MRQFFITTSIVYPNAKAHIGYAMELVQADFLARYYRSMGREVVFSTGIDEHGLKVQRVAESLGMAPQAYVDKMAVGFIELGKKLELTNDLFIRTSSELHKEVAQALWRRCLEAGDIYKKRYQAWYNVKEEEFLGLVSEFPDSSVFGIDPQYIERIDEENYFFRLSRYTEKIKEVLGKGEYKVLPEHRLTEILHFVVEKGLSDISISRESSRLGWGVPVPDDDTQVMYVWFDALANYLTASIEYDGRGISFSGGVWPASLHCIGKDISRFHSIIWTGMLLSAGIELPEQLMIHGFITSGGQKMSKSVGNVVDPIDILERYTADTVRWYLLKEVPSMDDADFTETRLDEVIRADLANDYGNLVSRVLTMAQKYCEGRVPTVEQAGVLEPELLKDVYAAYHLHIEKREINLALKKASELVVYANKLVDEKKPWLLAKDISQVYVLNELLYTLLEIVRHISLLYSPVMPGVTLQVLDKAFPELKSEKKILGAGAAWGGLVSGSPLSAESIILFPRKND